MDRRQTPVGKARSESTCFSPEQRWKRLTRRCSEPPPRFAVGRFEICSWLFWFDRLQVGWWSWGNDCVASFFMCYTASSLTNNQQIMDPIKDRKRAREFALQVYADTRFNRHYALTPEATMMLSALPRAWRNIANHTAQKRTTFMTRNRSSV